MKSKLILEFSDIWLKACLIDPLNKQEPKALFLEPMKPGMLDMPLAVENIFKQIGKSKQLELVLILTRSKSTLRRIDLPSRDAGELEQMLSLHVIRQVPYPKEEIIWGYKNLGFDGTSNSRLLLAIVHRDILRNIFNAFLTTNILPESIFVSSQGLVHYVSANCKDKTLLQQAYLVLDIDAMSSDLICVNKQQLSSSVSISLGNELLKTEDGMLKFFPEMRQALLAFREELMGVKTVTIFITGIVSGLKDLESKITQELNLKTQILTTNDAIDVKAQEMGVSITALNGFVNLKKEDDLCFILPEAKVKKEVKQKIQQLLILGISIIYIVVMIGLIVFAVLSKKQGYKDKLEARIESLKDKNKPLEQAAQTLASIKEYTSAKVSVQEYLYELNRIIPDSVVLTSFLYEKKSGLTLKGYATQMPDIFSFVSTLDNSKLFKGAKNKSTRKHKVKDAEVVDFEIGIK